MMISCATKPGSVSAPTRKSILPEVHGHRGARWVRPENTMAAFRYAVEEGVDTLELDLHVTRDNVLVITHDPILNRKICLDSKGRVLRRPVVVRKVTLKKLQSYDCGSLINPSFPRQMTDSKESIPTYEALLEWLKTEPKAKNVKLNVEAKSNPFKPTYTPDPKTFALMILEATKRHGFLDRLTLQSFDPRIITVARELEPKVTLSILLEKPSDESLAQIATRLKADIVSPHHEWLTLEDVETAHKNGVRVIPWTVNDEAGWRRMATIGVDGIITDNPKGLKEFLDQRGQ